MTASRGRAARFAADGKSNLEAKFDAQKLAFGPLMFQAARALRKQLRGTDADLIHFACSRSHKVGALACAFLGGLPPRVVTRRV